jgi:hypothetical protein
VPIPFLQIPIQIPELEYQTIQSLYQYSIEH